MPKGLITQQHLEDIADAIRGRNNSLIEYKPSEMAAAVSAISNSYTAGDEGKVVKNGELVAQTARASAITQNGTFDTTENNSVTVNVSGSSAVVQSLNVTQNGTYNPPSGVDGYAPVTVDVSGGGSTEPALPAEYQRVEYLYFTPSIGIVVTIPTSGKFLYIADYSSDKTESGSSSDVFGYRLASTNAKDFELRVTNASTANYIRGPSEATGLALDTLRNYTPGTRIKSKIILIDPRNTALIGKYAHNYSTSNVDPLALKGKFYSLIGKDIFSEGIIAWYVPCYRKSDNQVGVYDHIAQAFYYETYSVGSGYSIVAGPDVT